VAVTNIGGSWSDGGRNIVAAISCRTLPPSHGGGHAGEHAKLVREEFRFHKGGQPESSGEPAAAGSETETADDPERPGEPAPS